MVLSQLCAREPSTGLAEAAQLPEYGVVEVGSALMCPAPPDLVAAGGKGTETTSILWWH